MHEMSIVEALLDSVREQLRAYPDGQVRAVCVRVGQLRQIEPQMLEFCYNAAVRGTPLEGSRLEIQQVEAAARCDVCSLEFAVEENWFECPRCHSTNARLLRGDELLLTSIEIENVPPSDTAVPNSHAHCNS
jgi:hydrogenase nickel incorporation protein HypA/HybF